MVMVGFPSRSSAAVLGRLGAPGPVGTVDTVAGPGFCDGTTVPNSASEAVGALAVDGDDTGSIWFESGRPGDGLITKVLNNASVILERSGAETPLEGASVRPGTVASTFASATRLAPDGSNGVLVAKPGAILRLADGALTTLAGTTSASTGVSSPGDAAGDGGLLQSARFKHVAAIASDRSGNVYVADEVDDGPSSIVIRFLNRSDESVTFYAGTARQVTVAPGTIDTIAGSRRGNTDAGGDLLIRLIAPAPALAVVGETLYLAASRLGARSGATVRVINLSGEELSVHGKVVAPAAMTTVATVTGSSRLPPGAPGSANVSALPGIAADGEGNLFLAERANHRIRRIDRVGTVSTFAGTGTSGFNGNDRPAVNARLDRPYAVAVGAGGRVYISDAGNTQVRVVDQGGTIRAALGNGAAARWLCVPPPGNSSPRGFSRTPHTGTPEGLAADRSGNVYIATAALGAVHRLTPSGALRTVAGGRPSSCRDLGGCSTVEGSPSAVADLVRPGALALGPGGGVYVQDEGRVRFINLGRKPVRVHGLTVAPGTVRTVAGKGTPWGSRARPGDDDGARAADGARAVDATIGLRGARPAAIAADGLGNLLLVDYLNHGADAIREARLRQVDVGGIRTTLLLKSRPAGGMIGEAECCALVAGVTADPAGNLYISSGGRVWFLNRSPATVVVHGVSVPAGTALAVAGSTTPGGEQQEGGRALDEPLLYPTSLALDGSRNLYVLTSDHTVRRVDTAGTITTVAGTGQRGFNGDGLKGRLTAFAQPSNIAIDACGNLLIADTGNDRVRRLNLVPSCPRRRAATTSGAARHPFVIAALVITAVVALLTARFAARRGRRSPPRPRRHHQLLDASSANLQEALPPCDLP